MREGIKGLLTVELNLWDSKWRIVEVYVNEDMEGKLEYMREWMKGEEGGIDTIIGRDFNARTGEESRRIREED